MEVTSVRVLNTVDFPIDHEDISLDFDDWHLRAVAAKKLIKTRGAYPAYPIAYAMFYTLLIFHRI